MTAIGSALHQTIEDESRPIAFFSAKLTATEQRYSTFDRELLAIYRSIQHFQKYIEGQNVTIFTDHKPIVSAFKSKQSLKNSCPRRDRHFAYILESCDDVIHVAGSDNVVADTLSRPVSAISVTLTDLPAIAEAQQNDSHLSSLREKHPHRFKAYPTGSQQIYCDVSSPYPRPYISNVSQRTEIIREFHELCHPSWKRTSSLIKSRYCWPEMDRTIKEFCKHCETCQRNKVTTHIRSPPTKFCLPSARFESVHTHSWPTIL